MPSSAEHRAKYEANRRLLDGGNNGTPLSTLDGCWAAVVAFYAALHLADRLGAVAAPPRHPRSHGVRLRFLGSSHHAIYADYIDLKIASEVARYGTLNQFDKAYPGTTVQDILIDRRLVAIEAYVNSLFPAPPAAGAGG